MYSTQHREKAKFYDSSNELNFMTKRDRKRRGRASKKQIEYIEQLYCTYRKPNKDFSTTGEFIYCTYFVLPEIF